MWVFDSSNPLSKALRRKKIKQIKLLLPISDDEDCRGNLVSCPRRLFPVFDCYKNPNTGTFICEAHLRLADKDKRICDNEAYTPPKKVRHWHLVILPSPGMLLCTTKPFVGVSDNLPRPQTHPQTQLYLFDQRSRSQSTDSTSPNPDRDELLKKIEELENGKKQKLVEEQRKADEKKHFPDEKKFEGTVSATVIMKEISLATKDRT